MNEAGKNSGNQSHDYQPSEILDFAINKVYEAALLVDKNSHLFYVNDNACKILGYTRDELMQQTVADFDPDFPTERWTGHWSELRLHGSLMFERRHKTKDSRIFPVKINANYFEFEGQTNHLAWVGYAENDAIKSIRPIAWAGSDSDYIENARLSWSGETERGKRLAWDVIRNGKVVYVNDFSTNARMVPWRKS